MRELEKRVEWLELQMRLVHRTLDKIDRKTEPTSSKMEQVDKDINVRSKEEPYIDIETGILHWCGWKYKRIYEDEPQTDCAWR